MMVIILCMLLKNHLTLVHYGTQRWAFVVVEKPKEVLFSWGNFQTFVKKVKSFSTITLNYSSRFVFTLVGKLKVVSVLGGKHDLKPISFDICYEGKDFNTTQFQVQRGTNSQIFFQSLE